MREQRCKSVKFEDLLAQTVEFVLGDEIVQFGVKSVSKLLSFCWVEGQGILTYYSFVGGTAVSGLHMCNLKWAN